MLKGRLEKDLFFSYNICFLAIFTKHDNRNLMSGMTVNRLSKKQTKLPLETKLIFYLSLKLFYKCYIIHYRFGVVAQALVSLLK